MTLLLMEEAGGGGGEEGRGEHYDTPLSCMHCHDSTIHEVYTPPFFIIFFLAPRRTEREIDPSKRSCSCVGSFVCLLFLPSPIANFCIPSTGFELL